MLLCDVLYGRGYSINVEKKRFNRFGDALIMYKGLYAYKNYLRIRYGVIPLIIPREKFGFNRPEGLISYPLFIFNKNVEKEKKR